jgi:hypothetical protein
MLVGRMVHDWFYAVECYQLRAGSCSSSSSSSGAPELIRISPAELAHRLRNVARDAARRLRNGERVVPIGVLSSDGRDRWAEVGYSSMPCFSSYSVSLSVLNRFSTDVIQ